MHTPHTAQLDVLFVSEAPLWPLDQGFRIRGSNMAKQLAAMGYRVGIAHCDPTDTPPPLDLRPLTVAWPTADSRDRSMFMRAWRGPGARLRHRIADHQGRDLDRFAAVVTMARRLKPKVVIGLGQHAPLMLRGLADRPDIKRIWYAADDLVQYQLTCMRREGVRGIAKRARLLALYAAIETCFARGIDGAIGVSPTDTTMLRRIAGAKETITIRNGVDTDYFHPGNENEHAKNIVFWGRLDFEPNIDAVTWFAKHVWPVLHNVSPEARWHVIGKNPTRRVLNLSGTPGLVLHGEVDDLRPLARRAGTTILPMRCGAGIKNKLLEAAAMARPIVASPQAVSGLTFDEQKPMRIANTPDQWVEAITQLWSDENMRRGLGHAALQWVESRHTWRAAAQELANFIGLDAVAQRASSHDLVRKAA